MFIIIYCFRCKPYKINTTLSVNIRKLLNSIFLRNLKIISSVTYFFCIFYMFQNNMASLSYSMIILVPSCPMANAEGIQNEYKDKMQSTK